MQAAPEEVNGDRVVEGKPKIEQLLVVSGTHQPQQATVTIVTGGKHETAQAVSMEGPLDAIARAIGKIVQHDAELASFRAKGLKEGTDAVAEVVIVVTIGSKRYRSRSEDRDTNLAFARAYLGAVNQARAATRKVPRRA